jgi:hypothetical protein
MEFQARQGDVFIKKLPKGSIKGEKTPRQKGQIILASGESHTHCHAIADKETDLYIDGARKFLEVCLEQGASLKVDMTEKNTVTIPRHYPVIVPEGEYEVIIQKQWDYMKQLSQQVRD